MDDKSDLNKYKNRFYKLLYILLAIIIMGIVYRLITYMQLKNVTERESILSVATITAAQVPLYEKLTLPANIQAWHDATINARTNGYVVRWMVDIGAHVKAGDLLAELTAPEVVAELNQTEANLKTAITNYNLAQRTANRWVFLLKTESVSKQETDEKVSDAFAKAAIVTSTKANRDRLRDLVSFQRILAPFDGVITSRTTDIGRLINAGSGSVPLFRLVQANRLRVYVRVPAYFADRIKPDIKAYLSFTEHPGKTYSAKLLATAKAIDLKTRTLLVQLEVDNADEALFSGSYTQVHFTIPVSKTHVRLPVNTLIFRSKGIQVAKIDGDSKAILKPITVGRDFGDVVEVVHGVLPGEKIILNPPDSLSSGQKVKIVSLDPFSKDKKTA